MELCKLDAGILLVDAHSRLLNAEQLSLMRGIPELGVLLLLLLVLCCSSAVFFALDLKADTDVPLFLNSEFDSANGELHCFQL